ncbi:TPA: phage tail tape measure protein [Escherichia coli]|nr:phage tail tape measure protein [Escherichia coli]HDJ8887810.1 phage tail tape measure protein [Escherichia coli]HDJ8915004.1 phage tail tape measure protein [Escherichia coli]
MGTLETWADKTAQAFKSMWDAVLDIGRPDSSADMLAKAEKAFDEADKKWQWYQSRSHRRGKTSAFLANLRGGHGRRERMRDLGFQPPRCRQILKRPVRWQQKIGPSLRHHG